jgi:hypothetical protein
VLESLYTRFLSSPPDNPASNHKSISKSGWSKDHPRISPTTGCYMSHGNNKKIYYKIQVNNNLRKKWLKTNIPQSVELDCQRTAAPFSLRSSLRRCVSTKSFIGLGSLLRAVACKIKMLTIKYIYK